MKQLIKDTGIQSTYFIVYDVMENTTHTLFAKLFNRALNQYVYNVDLFQYSTYTLVEIDTNEVDSNEYELHIFESIDLSNEPVIYKERIDVIKPTVSVDYTPTSSVKEYDPNN